MLVLGIDSSATAASVAIIDGEKLLGEYFVNTQQTHSQTLMPMVQGLLSSVGKSCEDIELLAVSNGPGSFTGIRIGVSCVKGLALPLDIPCCGVSTLEVIAYGGISSEGSVLCAVMDARCNQVYNGLFRAEKGKLIRLSQDRAVSISELSEECRSYGESLLILGDGARLCYKEFSAWGARIAPDTAGIQRASSVAYIGLEMAARGESIRSSQLLPSYLRLPQAERELKKRTESKGE